MIELKLGNYKLYLEIPIFLYNFSFIISNTIALDFLIHRSCEVALGYSKSECDLLGKGETDDKTQKLEDEAQAYATELMTYSSVSVAFLPPILCFFLGPWSNIYGRKPLMLLSTTGILAFNVVFVVVTAIPDASPWFLLAAVVPMTLTGGIPAVFTGFLSYITDVTTEADRGTRMGVFEIITTAANLLGQISSSYILEAWGYVTVYAICSLCMCFNLLYIAFLVPESVPNPKKEDKLKNLFRFSEAVDTFKISFKKREGFNRSLILIVMFITFSFMLSNNGASSVLFFYLRKTFQWSLKHFTLYSALANVGGIFGGIFGVFFLHKFLGIKEIYVIFVSLISPLLGTLFQGLATEDWHLYVSACVKLLGDALAPMGRSLLSKLVPLEEASKVFAVVSTLDMMGALAGVTFYTYFYNLTLSTYPPAFNFLAVGIYAVGILFLIVFFAVQKYNNNKLSRRSESEIEIVE